MAVQIRNRREATEKIAVRLEEHLNDKTDHEWYVALAAEGSHPTPAELERIGDARADLQKRLAKLAGKA